MTSNKEVLFKKSIDVLQDCKSSPSKENAKDAFGKHITNQLRSFFTEAAIFISFKNIGVDTPVQRAAVTTRKVW